MTGPATPLLRRARLLLAHGMVCYMAGVFLVSAPWRLGANYASLVRAVQLVLVSIVLALLSEVVSRLVGAGLHGRAILLAVLIAAGLGWLAILAWSYASNEYGDAQFWSARGADIRLVAVLGIGLSGLSALLLAAATVLVLTAGWRMWILPRSVTHN